jgi:hypothetical protein
MVRYFINSDILFDGLDLASKTNFQFRKNHLSDKNLVKMLRKI